MLKAAIHQGTEQLGLQEEVLETRRVHTDIVALAPFLPPGLGSLFILMKMRNGERENMSECGCHEQISNPF